MRQLGLIALTIVLLVVILLACNAQGAISVGGKGGAISFAEIFDERRGDELKLSSSQELDVDGDGDEEWAVFYHYDPFERDEWDSTPIQGVVYDALRCDPPLIHTWRLPHYDNDYLGEGGSVVAEMADVLPSGRTGDSENELVVTGNAAGVNTLNLFRFHDYRAQPECSPPDESQQGFDLVGSFRANGRIEINANEAGEALSVTTYNRTTYERSQLAIRAQYAPVEYGGQKSFIKADGQRVGPAEQSVDFLFDYPRSPMDSPYPEKAVAAFYLRLGVDNEQAKTFLVEALQASFDSNTFGTDLLPSQIKRVLIHSITYEPNREAELARQDRIVRLVIVPVNAQNQRLQPREVTWRLVGIPIEGQEDCEWRLAELIGQTLTDGLGMIPTEAPDGALAHVN